MRTFLLFLFFLISLTLTPTLIWAQGDQAGDQIVRCVADDENFVVFYDWLALTFALLGFLLIPLFLPAVSNNNWRFARPYGRLFHVALWSTLALFLLIFLPPQLARVSPAFRPFGLALFHSLGNIRLEYLTCGPALQPVPKDYGFFLFLRWNPGPGLTIEYWWAQVVVFFVYATIAGLLYLGLVRFWAPLRLRRMGR